MLRLVSKFVLEVLPAVCAAVIAGVLLSAYHPHFFGTADVGARQAVIEAVTIAPHEVAQRIDAEHAAVQVPKEETPAKPAESRPEAKTVKPTRADWNGGLRYAHLTPPSLPAAPAAALAVPSAPAANVSPLPTPISPGNALAAKPEPKRVLGVAIPRPISAIGEKLDPAPVLRASEKAIEKMVIAAKSVVHDFSW